MPGPVVRPQGFTSYPSFIPKLNASNPLTKGLVDAMLPVGSVVTRILGDGRQTVMARNGTLTNAYDSVIGFGRKTPANSTTDFDTSATTAAMPGSFGLGASCLKECSMLVLTRVGSSTTASTFLAGYGNTTNATPIFGFQLGSGNSQWVFYVRDNASGGQQVAGTLAATVVDKAFCLLGTRSESANYHRSYVNGVVDVNTTASATSTATYDNATFNTVRRSGALATVGGVNALVLVWNRALTPAEARSISDNPWQVFEVPSRAILANSVAGGDVTAVGSSSGVATAQATGASTSEQVAASAGVATAQATGASTSEQVASAAGTVTVSDFINGTVSTITAVGSSSGTATVLGISLPDTLEQILNGGGWPIEPYRRPKKWKPSYPKLREEIEGTLRKLRGELEEIPQAPAHIVAKVAKAIEPLQDEATLNELMSSRRQLKKLEQLLEEYERARIEDEEEDELLLLH